MTSSPPAAAALDRYPGDRVGSLVADINDVRVNLLTQEQQRQLDKLVQLQQNVAVLQQSQRQIELQQSIVDRLDRLQSNVSADVEHLRIEQRTSFRSVKDELTRPANSSTGGIHCYIYIITA